MFEVVMQDLDDLRRAEGSNAKKYILKRIDPLTQRVFEYALDPYKTFGIIQFKPHGAMMQLPRTPDDLFRNLDLLVTRTVTGNAAKELCADMVGSGVPLELLQNILKKDLRCGIAAKTYNSVYPGAIPTFEVALAEPYEEAEDMVFPKYASIKYDGFRCIAHVTNTGVRFLSRNGIEILTVEAIKPKLAAWSKENFGIEPMMFDGELMIRDGHFQVSSSALRKGDTQAKNAVYMIFDILSLQEFTNQNSRLSQSERIDILNRAYLQLPELEIVRHIPVQNHAEVMQAYADARASKHEGLILKDPEATYQFKRSKAWLKIKDQKTVDLTVTGVEPGKGKYEGKVGALMVDFEGKPNRVGTGLSDEDRERTDWVGKVVEVAYHELTADGNMRHSRLIQERPDKREV